MGNESLKLLETNKLQKKTLNDCLQSRNHTLSYYGCDDIIFLNWRPSFITSLTKNMSRKSRSGTRPEGGPSVNFSLVAAGDSKKDQMRPAMHHYLHHHRHSKWKVVLFNQLLSLIAILINLSPHATASPAVKRGGTTHTHVYITHRPYYYVFQLLLCSLISICISLSYCHPSQ